MAIDQIPHQDDIGVESIVLFQQGGYSSGEQQQSGGTRWHQGKITKVYQGANGNRLYDGCHTKSQLDGKWITYRGYSPTFKGLSIEELRRGPNWFDVIDKCSDIAIESLNSATSLQRNLQRIHDDHREVKIQEAVDESTRKYVMNIKEKILEMSPSFNEDLSYSTNKSKYFYLIYFNHASTQYIKGRSQ